MDYSEYSLDNPRLEHTEKEYKRLHIWIRKLKGSPMKCDRCGVEGRKIYDWSNKSGEYRSEIDDWWRLCRSCHFMYDNVAIKQKRTMELKKEYRESGKIQSD